MCPGSKGTLEAEEGSVEKHKLSSPGCVLHKSELGTTSLTPVLFPVF